MPPVASLNKAHQFFTVRPRDSPALQAWLDKNGQRFRIFWASFINFGIRLAQRVKHADSVRGSDEDAILAVLSTFPAVATDVIEILELFQEKYYNVDRPTEGTIKYIDGRAPEAAISAAQSVLYDLVFSSVQQRANAPAQAAVASGSKESRRKRKLELRAARRGEQGTSSDAHDEQEAEEEPAEARTMQLPLRPLPQTEGDSEQGLSRFTLAMRPYQPPGV